jgi:hypothetical protein
MDDEKPEDREKSRVYSSVVEHSPAERAEKKKD